MVQVLPDCDRRRSPLSCPCARADGESQWITGPEARAHGHLERSRVEAILVGRGTFEADAPRLDVRLAGLEGRSPNKHILSTTKTARPEPVEGLSLSSSDGAEEKAGLRQAQPERWEVVSSLQDITTLLADHLLIEGGAGAASAFLSADLVDRLLIYRSPILIGGGKLALHDIGLTTLADAHSRWRNIDSRRLGADRLDIYERVRD
jgi:diaminohydroxyphosphoribosylaminopyrimidine deaminase / 5-amino-6-(5-phosphoribosylamino)uracil reductase